MGVTRSHHQQRETKGRTERKSALHWSMRGMKVGDLAGTAGNPHIDALCDRLFNTSPKQTTDTHVPIVNYKDAA